MRGPVTAVLLALLAGPAASQQMVLPSGPILTLDEARFFEQSRFGQRIQGDLEKRQAELLAENRKIEAELTKEERALTERRPDLSPQDFRALADAFDARVQSIRNTQEAKSRALLDASEQARAQFFPAAREVLAKLMTEAGAMAILSDEAIVLSFQQIDVTDAAIARLDASIGDGAPGPRVTPAVPLPGLTGPTAVPPRPTDPAPADPTPTNPGAAGPGPADTVPAD
ncbi:MAG: OmpH family outer membrane protein [Gemmobacter sp.]|nr:OmpH family outer membrane protein [Gemmobacter sp.]